MNYFETSLEEISRSIQLLAQIFEYQVFELQIEEKDGDKTGYVPYMMNDAIECYLSFHGLKISGKYDKDYEGELWCVSPSNPSRPSPSPRQENCGHKRYINLYRGI